MLGEPEPILRDMSDGVVVMDAKGRLKTINPAARALLELGDGELAESFASLFIGDRRNDGFVQSMLDALHAEDVPGSRIVDYFTKSGQQRKVSVKATFTQSDTGGKELIAVLSDVTERENAIVFRKDVTILISIVFLAVCLFLYVYKALETFLPGSVSPSLLIYGLLAVMLIVAYVITKTTSLHPRLLLRSKGAKKAIFTSVILTVCAIAVMIAVKAVLLWAGSDFFRPDAPFFNFSRFTAKELYLYLPSVILQEFIARSVMQEGFIYVYSNQCGALAILVPSMIFGVLHLPYSFAMMVGAALLLGALGLFYQKNRNLVSVIIVHYFATEAAMILGLL